MHPRWFHEDLSLSSLMFLSKIHQNFLPSSQQSFLPPPVGLQMVVSLCLHVGAFRSLCFFCRSSFVLSIERRTTMLGCNAPMINVFEFGIISNYYTYTTSARRAHSSLPKLGTNIIWFCLLHFQRSSSHIISVCCGGAPPLI